MNYDEFNATHSFEEKCGFKLSPLQRADVIQFAEWGRCLNAYSVGGGKTVVSTAVSLINDCEQTVVIVPPILLLPWERWLKKFSTSVVRYQGTPKERNLIALKTFRWVIMSHAIFRKDYEHIKYSIKSDKDIIIDEAQCIKSPEAQLYKKVNSFAIARPIQMLTGTPTSKPLDCYTYCRIKTPNLYRSYSQFEQMYVHERDFFGAVKSYKNLDDLANKFSMQTIKRDKEELHGYSIKPIYPDTTYELDADHMKLYRQLVEEQLLTLPDDTQIDATTATRMYHALQQVIVNYDYFSGDPTKRSKSYDLLDYVMESTDCLNVSKSKLIVWTYYKRTTAAVVSYLRGLNINVVAAYSAVNSSKNFEIFMEDPKCRVLVAQPASAGVGLNPQAICSEMLFLETSTTPMQARQSVGRIDRVGQTVTPTIRFGVAKGTIQEYLLEMLMEKDDLVSQVERTPKSLRQVLLGG